MKVITESEMDFGPFDEKNLFHIEESRIYKDLGTGIKTVEFILKYSENSIVFLEAKTRCPNAANRDESEEKEDKFEEYYSSVTEKFAASLQIYLASVLHRYQDTSEVGEALQMEDGRWYERDSTEICIGCEKCRDSMAGRSVGGVESSVASASEDLEYRGSSTE